MINTYNIYLFTMYVIAVSLLLIFDTMLMGWIDDKRIAEKKNPRRRLAIARIWKRFDRLASLLIIISIVWPILWIINYIVGKICNKMIGMVMNNV